MLIVGFLVGKRENIEGYLVNNRKTKTILLIFTIVSTSVGMGVFLGISSEAYKNGISYGLTMMIASVLSLLLVAYFAPRIKQFGDKHKAHTLGDWFAVRYSSKNRLLVSIIILIAYFFLTALQFVGIAGLIHVISGLDFTIALVAASLVTIIYTTAAGIKSDFYTDAVQFVVMVFTLFLVLLPLSLIKSGGLGFLGSLPASHFNPFAFGGISFFIGGLVLGAPLLLVSMEIWQRIFAATTESEAKKVYLWSALLLVIFFIPAILLGLIAFKAVPGISPDFALFELMKQGLPAGFMGLGVAGILAAAMSTIDSMILVGSATILKDIHKTFINPDLTDKQMLRLGRIYTCSYGLLGLAAAYLIPHIIQLQIISGSALLVLGPATIGGFVWKESTAKASFWSILIGFIATFSLYPLMPTLSFIPGTLISLILFIAISKLAHKGL
ncbi:MAG TPA: sodium:solute symporter family protein [Nanoarchaeota archaeon]|nr:sodium:solute symporter family protein [Nanoarchaeota archaeon]